MNSTAPASTTPAVARIAQSHTNRYLEGLWFFPPARMILGAGTGPPYPRDSLQAQRKEDKHKHKSYQPRVIRTFNLRVET